MGFWIDIVAIGIIVVCAVAAFRRGFVKTFFGFISTIVAIVLACVLSNSCATYIKENTEIDEWIKNTIVSINKQEVENGDSTVLVSNVESGEENTNGGNFVEISGDMDFLSLVDSLPDALNSLINIDEMKEEATEKIVDTITNAVISILSWILVYAIVKIILLVIMVVFNGIMNLPILKTVNNLAGLIIGIVMGIFRIYLILAIIYFISNIVNITPLVEIISSASLVSHMYINNLLINLIF